LCLYFAQPRQITGNIVAGLWQRLGGEAAGVETSRGGRFRKKKAL
jgi:hypothetical protein